MSAEDDSKKRKLTLRVTSQVAITTFANKKGSGEVTLYAVEAEDADGNKLDDNFRSFAELEIGRLTEYEAEDYHHEKYGKSITLSRPRHNTAQRVTDLEGLVEELQERLTKVEGQLRADDLEFRDGEAKARFGV